MAASFIIIFILVTLLLIFISFFLLLCNHIYKRFLEAASKSSSGEFLVAYPFLFDYGYKIARVKPNKKFARRRDGAWNGPRS